MRSFYLLQKWLLSCSILFLIVLAPIRESLAQISDIGEFFEAGKEDAELLLKEYLKPFGNGFGAGINSGWIDKAQTHRLLGFHVKVNVAFALVPDADRSFDVTQVGLSSLSIDPADDPVTPTFSGTSSPGPRLFIQQTLPDGREIETANFRMPEGIGLNFVPTPMLQAGLGLPKNTDIMLRVIPPANIGDFGELYLYGLGFKHEFNQWMPGGSLWPVTFSVMAGYTRFGSSAGLEARPKTPYVYPEPTQAGGLDLRNPGIWDNQEVSLQADALTVNLLTGFSLPVLSLYGGIGYETSTTNISVSGNYPYYVPDIQDGQAVRVLAALSDPLDVSIEGANSVRALAGIRISLPLLTFNVDYTVAEYSMISAGVGISIR